MRVAAALSILLAASYAAADNKNAEAQQLLEQVKKNTQLFSANAQPYHLNAALMIYGLGPSPITGSADIEWTSPDRWRQEIHIGEFDTIEIHVGQDQYWRKRSVAYEPNPVRFIRSGLDFAAPRFGFDESGSVTKKIKHDSWHGVAVACLARERTHAPSTSELCIDTAKGLPLRERFDNFEWLYSDYVSFNGKAIPRQLDLSKDGKPYVAIRLEKVESPVSIAETEFGAGPGFEARPWCDKAIPPKPTKQPDPAFPESARGTGAEATVTLNGEVGLDGLFHHPAITMTGGADFDSAAIQAIDHWRFQPALCHGSPIPVEISIEIRFRHRY